MPAGGDVGTVPDGGEPDEYFLPDGDVAAGGEDFGCDEEPDEYFLPPLPEEVEKPNPMGFVLPPDEYDEPDGLELLPEE